MSLTLSLILQSWGPGRRWGAADVLWLLSRSSPSPGIIIVRRLFVLGVQSSIHAVDFPDEYLVFFEIVGS